MSGANLTVVRRIEFCAGHRLLGHEGKCAALHGHNYAAEFHVTALDSSGTGLDDVGRVVDFAAIKEELKGWIDREWDHGFLLWEGDEAAIAAVRAVEPCKLFTLPANPTAEVLAEYLLTRVCPARLAPLGVRCTRLELWETPNCRAVASLPA
ncbi:6-pyruvoyl trahydropterin synthase family protein [Alienimonas californiensis]|uniref:6-carboxy-5,6,7,8-tetrahydropterin synthase n=1 Tax=Alienimonas californiensis TaxID=2527989 RepID=A0A517PBU9_9PLAN|nr:6-carboxytetrahydropterin synthase [Alienimonas californiensis]QDT16836.1 6-pyruvoyl tetrahydropterin synthase [Alienimonas californiensis]